MDTLVALSVKDEILTKREKSDARRQIGSDLSYARLPGKSPTLALQPIRQPQGGGGIACADIAHKVVEVAVCVRRETRPRRPLGARPLDCPEPSENIIGFKQFAAIRLFDSVVDFTNQLVVPHGSDVIVPLNPLRERETIIHGQLRRLGFEFFDRHAVSLRWHVIPGKENSG